MAASRLRLRAAAAPKHNRAREGIPKTHALDAASGEVGTRLADSANGIKGERKRVSLPHGFARSYCARTKCIRVLNTSDMVQAEAPNATRQTPSGASPFVPAALFRAAMPTPSAANFFARTAMAMLGGPRFLPRLTPGVSSAGGADDGRSHAGSSLTERRDYARGGAFLPPTTVATGNSRWRPIRLP
jgi:hypothetical protein